MNGNEENKELIQRMAEALRDHAEPYREGAWERFAAVQGMPRKRILLWPYGTAAAVLLLAIGLLWFNRPGGAGVSGPVIAGVDTSVEPLVKEAGKSVQPEAPRPQQQADVQTQAAMQDRAGMQATISVRETTTLQATVALVETEGEESLINQLDTGSVALETSPQHLAVAPEREVSEPDEVSQGVPEDVGFLDLETAGQALAAETSSQRGGAEKKWNLGVMVAPTLTSEKINWGGGVTVAYQLSDKFSVGSGVSVGRLGLGENSNHNPQMRYGSVAPSDSPVEGGGMGFAKDRQQYKEDLYITSNVVTLDIPLDLRYEVKSGFYTSVGISYVAVLNEQRTEHFIDGLNRPSFENSHAKDLLASTTVGYVSEKLSAQPLEGRGYAGFMNFSIGRKMPISKRLSLSIEPYFKLPIGRLSREEMNFTNGGIRIVTGF